MTMSMLMHNIVSKFTDYGYVIDSYVALVYYTIGESTSA